LRITVQTPPKSINNDNLELFRTRVETATGGALKISIHVGLVEDSQVRRSCRMAGLQCPGPGSVHEQSGGFAFGQLRTQPCCSAGTQAVFTRR
jgi:hypothetical protein